MKMYGSLSDEDLNEWERLPSVMCVLCSAQMGAWLLRRDENKEKSEHKTGRWKFIVYDANRIGHYECTECHWNVLMNVSDYCPHCGAKMEVEE
jgi:hypothetical protein